MRILITTDLYTTDTNGVVTSTKNLVRALKSHGHEVRVLTFSQSRFSYRTQDEYYIPSVPIGIYPDVRMPFLYRHKFIKELILWKPDIIHSQCEFFSMTCAKRISKKTHAPIVHTYHTLYEHYIGYVLPFQRIGEKVIRWYIRKRLNRTMAVIVPTEKIQNHLSSYKLKVPTYIIPSGISLNQHRNRISPETRARMRKEIGISEDETVLIYLGRIAAEKNLKELIDNYTKACQNTEKLKLLIVGDGPYSEELKQYASHLKNCDKTFFTGMVKPETVHMYYQLGDIFVSTSTSETQGLTYIEAMANGLPLLCKRDSCLTEVISQGINGFQFENSEQFEKMLNQSLDKEWLILAGKQSIATANKYDISYFGDSVEKIYLSAISKVANKYHS